MKYYEMLKNPAWRDPRGFIIPSDQPDFPTATKFVNALIKTGITIHRATAPFTVAGKSYPAGSYVVKAAQAFRPWPDPHRSACAASTPLRRRPGAG